MRDWGFVKAWPSRFPESSPGFAARAWATAYSRNPTRTFPNPQSRTPNPGRNGHCPHPHHGHGPRTRSEEHTSELQSLMRISYAVFCLKQKHKDQIIAHMNKYID